MIRFTSTFMILVLSVSYTFSQQVQKTAIDNVIDIGSRRELFVDYYLIDRMQGAELRLHEPQDEGPVFYFDNPWEGQFSGYCTIIKEDSLFRAYYRGIPTVGNDGNKNEVTCIAESKDGINWEKPNLGIFEFNGTKSNNIILANAAPVTHNFSPFLDTKPGITKTQKYKALGGTSKSGLIAFASADGILWEKMRDEPVITDGKFDSQNVAFWSESEQCYVSYFRIWTKTGYSGFRSVGRATSNDFLNWTATTPMTFGDSPMQHLYTNQTHPYYRAPHIYIAIAARFMPGRQVVSEDNAQKLNVNPKYFKDCSDAVFMTSRGGNEYDRTFMQGFINPGIGLQNWVSRTNYPALNVVQTGPYEMSVYVNQDYAQPTAHLHRYSMRLDGFASVYAPFEGGQVLTKPFKFKGQKLSLNFSTSAAGSVIVEITNKDGQPINRFTLGDSNELIGNEIDKSVTWNSQNNLNELAGKTIRLRFFIKDAHIYSFQFY